MTIAEPKTKPTVTVEDEAAASAAEQASGWKYHWSQLRSKAEGWHDKIEEWRAAVERAADSHATRETVHAIQDAWWSPHVVTGSALAAFWLGDAAPLPHLAGLVGVGVPALAAWLGRNAAPIVRRRAMAAGFAGTGVLYAASGEPSPMAYVAAVVTLAGLTAATMQRRARQRIRRRIRERLVNASHVEAEQIKVRRQRWKGRTLTRIRVGFPEEFRDHAERRRDEVEVALAYALAGVPPTTPDPANLHPEYEFTWDHTRRELLAEAAPLLPASINAWDIRDLIDNVGPRGILLGQTAKGLHDEVIGGRPVAVFRPRRHLLIAGATQYGKSAMARYVAAQGLRLGWYPGGVFVIDYKSSGSFAPLARATLCHGMAHQPHEWSKVLQDVLDLVQQRYAELLAWREGRGPKPHHPAVLAVIDEVQQGINEIGKDFEDGVNQLARLALESNVILVVLTQRPDARDAIPGAIRDQIDDRAALGPLSPDGSKMMFGPDWSRALTTAPLAGRVLLKIGGKLRFAQVPFLDMPVVDARLSVLYPALADHSGPRLHVVQPGQNLGGEVPQFPANGASRRGRSAGS